jgi:hypothetical protein
LALAKSKKKIEGCEIKIHTEFPDACIFFRFAELGVEITVSAVDSFSFSKKQSMKRIAGMLITCVYTITGLAQTDTLHVRKPKLDKVIWNAGNSKNSFRSGIYDKIIQYDISYSCRGLSQTVRITGNTQLDFIEELPRGTKLCFENIVALDMRGCRIHLPSKTVKKGSDVVSIYLVLADGMKSE